MHQAHRRASRPFQPYIVPDFHHVDSGRAFGSYLRFSFRRGVPRREEAWRRKLDLATDRVSHHAHVQVKASWRTRLRVRCVASHQHRSRWQWAYSGGNNPSPDVRGCVNGGPQITHHHHLAPFFYALFTSHAYIRFGVASGW